MLYRRFYKWTSSSLTHTSVKKELCSIPPHRHITIDFANSLLMYILVAFFFFFGALTNNATTTFRQTNQTMRAMRGGPGLLVYFYTQCPTQRFNKLVCGHWCNDFLGWTAFPWPSSLRGCLERSPFLCPRWATKRGQLLLCSASLASASGLHQAQARKRNLVVVLLSLVSLSSNPSAILSSDWTRPSSVAVSFL